MKTLISLQDIFYAHDSTPLFEGVSFSINQGERVAVVGHNGCGKSTLLSLMSEKLSPQAGLRTCMRGLKLELVEQFLPKELEEFTLREAVLDKLPIEKREFEAYVADCVLDDLFFQPSQYNIPVKGLSGGQKNRLMIARAIINEPDLVLMDEPTNHLDLKTLLYIEKYFLEKAKFAYAIISHDKRFLDQVTNKTLIIRDGLAHSFALPYSKSLVELEKRDEHDRKALELEQKEIDRLKASAKRLAQWGKVYDNEDLSKKAKSMEKRVEKMEQNKTFVSKGNPYSLDLKTSQTKSKLAIQLHNHSVFYGESQNEESQLFSIEKAFIPNGDKVAILGDNGVGKTTFLKKLVRDIQNERHDQHFRRSPNLELGLYDQEQEVLKGKRSIFEEVQAQTKMDNDHVKQALISAGFSFEDHHRPINRLSGGERARIIFLILSLQKPNLLILDEPTNHIDLEGKSELAKMLIESSATIIITGHDREFIETVANRFFIISNGSWQEVSSADIFYQSLLENNPKTITSKRIESELNLKGDLLEQIELLEQKLNADLARKPKFQKPSLQARWREEIAKLYEQL